MNYAFMAFGASPICAIIEPFIPLLLRLIVCCTVYLVAFRTICIHSIFELDVIFEIGMKALQIFRVKKFEDIFC